MDVLRSQVGGQRAIIGGRRKVKLRLTDNVVGAKDTGHPVKAFDRVSNLQRGSHLTLKSKPELTKVTRCDFSTVRPARSRLVLNKLPAGVCDIDAGVTDPFRVPTYAEDAMHYLRAQERKFRIAPNYLHKRAVTPHMRRVLVDWLIQVQDHKGLEQETLHLTITVLDHFLHRHEVPVNKLQLAGITCLLIAAKYIERFAPEIDELVRLTDGAYTRNQVIRMEQVILKVLGFELYMPEPSVFLDRFLQIEDDRSNEKVFHLTWYLLDLSLSSSTVVPYAASMKAAAALALARTLDQQDIMGQPATWSTTMSHYTGYTIEALRPLMKLLLQGLVHAPCSKQTGAMTKFSSQSRRLAVAKWMATSQAPRATLSLCS